MQLFNRIYGKFTEYIEYLTVFQCQTLKDDTDKLTMCLRCVLSRTCTILTNGFRHILWIGKSRIIRIDETSKRAGSLGQFYHLRIRIIRSFLMPFLQTLFYNPHTCDILQQANGTVYSSFVSNIIVSCLFIHNRTICFNSHQRPCT